MKGIAGPHWFRICIRPHWLGGNGQKHAQQHAHECDHQTRRNVHEMLLVLQVAVAGQRDGANTGGHQ